MSRTIGELAGTSAEELISLLASGEVTSVDIVNDCIAYAAAIDHPSSARALNSIAQISPTALDEAAASDARRREGKLLSENDGLPLFIKDNIEAVGLPGAAGSTALAGRPTRDAALVRAARAAGLVIVGSTNLSEWANLRSPKSTSGWSALGGLVDNPWRHGRSAGGSSSGSGAAVGAGLTPWAVGTETDGSIICPASVSGVAGLKPTVGSISTDGVVPLSASQDSPGPIARRVSDVARLWSILSGKPVNPASPRLVIATNWLAGHEGTDEVVASVTEVLLAEHGAQPVVVADITEADGSDELTVLLCEMADDLSAYLAGRPGDGVTSLADVVAFEKAHADTELKWFGHEFFEKALELRGRENPDYAIARERNLRRMIDEVLEPALVHGDVLISAAYGPAWESDLVNGGHSNAFASVATMPAAIAGWPIATVPVGLVDGLPVGVSIVGRAGREDDVLAAAALIERIVNFSARPAL